jgi:hypothetical protein
MRGCVACGNLVRGTSGTHFISHYSSHLIGCTNYHQQPLLYPPQNPTAREAVAWPEEEEEECQCCCVTCREARLAVADATTVTYLGDDGGEGKRASSILLSNDRLKNASFCCRLIDVRYVWDFRDLQSQSCIATCS